MRYSKFLLIPLIALFCVKGSATVFNPNIFSGEQSFGTTAGAPLSTNTSNQLVSGITNYTATSTAAVTSGTTAAVITSMTATIATAGTYLVIYSGNLTASSAGGNVLTISILVGGTQQTQSIRTSIPFTSAALGVFQNMTISTNAIVTVTAGQAIAIQGQSSAGTVTTSQRELDIVRLQ